MAKLYDRSRKTIDYNIKREKTGTDGREYKAEQSALFEIQLE